MTKPNPAQASPANPLAAIMSQPYLLLTLSSLFWGGNIIAGKFAIGEIDPFGLSTMRWVAAFIIIMPFAWRAVREDWAEIRRGVWWLAFYGAIGFTTFNALLYLSVTYTSAVSVAMIQSAIPILVMVGNFIIFRVRASILHILGVVLTIYGVTHVATQGVPVRLLGLDVNAGDGLILIACLAYAFHSLFLRYKPKIGWMSFIAVTSFFAALAALFYQMVFSTGITGLAVEVTTLSFKAWMIILYVALFPSIIAQATYARGVELIGPNRGSLFINLIPVFGALLAVVLLGEGLEMFHIIAAVFIIAGIGLAELAARRGRPVLLPPGQ
jgi:drug/metabolite transporter (DMT)-like permease